MATFLNPAALSTNPELRAGVSAHLTFYASSALANEAPIIPQSTGYKAYAKRMDLARRIIADVSPFVDTATRLAIQVGNDVYTDAVINSSVGVYRYLLDTNPSGKPFAEMDPSQLSAWTPVGTTSGKSVFDVLAGVSQLDWV